MKRSPILACLILVCAASVQAADDSAEQNFGWKAGTASAVITPDRPLQMSGYGSRKKPALGTEQDLFAKALAIKDEAGNRVVFVTLDLIGVLAELRTAVAEQVEAKYALPPDALVMNASHTHCGPAYGRDDARDYFDSLKEKLVKLVGQSLERLEPASLSYSIARCGVAMNRRTPTASGLPQR